MLCVDNWIDPESGLRAEAECGDGESSHELPFKASNQAQVQDDGFKYGVTIVGGGGWKIAS